jgi:hypothetical protein
VIDRDVIRRDIWRRQRDMVHKCVAVSVGCATNDSTLVRLEGHGTWARDTGCRDGQPYRP